MLSKITFQKNKIKRYLLGVISFSTVMFVFQACYGSPKDFGLDSEISGCVLSTDGNTPLEGIKVSFENIPQQFTYTNNKGEFTIYASRDKSYNILFEDTTQLQKKHIKFDTTVTTKKKPIYLNIKMQSIE